IGGTAGKQEFHHTGGTVRRIPEGVRDTARLLDVGPGSGDRDRVTDAEPDLAVEDVRELVLRDVRVGRDEPVRGERELEDREGAAGGVARDLEFDVETRHRVSFAGTRTRDERATHPGSGRRPSDAARAR